MNFKIKKLLDHQMENYIFPLDFFGYNVYFANNYHADAKAPDKGWAGIPRTQMGWAITPEVLYWSKSFLTRRRTTESGRPGKNRSVCTRDYESIYQSIYLQIPLCKLKPLCPQV